MYYLSPPYLYFIFKKISVRRAVSESIPVPRSMQVLPKKRASSINVPSQVHLYYYMIAQLYDYMFS